MLSTAATTTSPGFVRSLPLPPATGMALDEGVNQRASQYIADTLKLVHGVFAPQRRMVHAGDVIYQTGERFGNLYVLNSGFFKVVNLSLDGREQVVGLKFRGDWLGFDGIANSRYTCDAVAMDTGEVWMLRYDTMLTACARR
jgi:CRP/FNR family transcriptional regulator, anaerobic regulatory protein